MESVGNRKWFYAGNVNRFLSAVGMTSVSHNCVGGLRCSNCCKRDSFLRSNLGMKNKKHITLYAFIGIPLGGL